MLRQSLSPCISRKIYFCISILFISLIGVGTLSIPSASRAQSEAGCGIGVRWGEAESGIPSVWTRRGTTNVFDAAWYSGNTPIITAVLTITLEGNTVNVARRQSSDGNDCDYMGIVASDGVTVQGSYQCTLYPPTTGWQATINCPPCDSAAGMVSWWKGNGDASDSSGYANNGTLENGLGFSAGREGQAFNLDGSDDYVNIPDSASLDAITNAVTIEGWINPQMPTAPPLGNVGSGRAAIVARRNPNIKESFELDIRADGRISVIVGTTSSSTSVFVSSNPVIQYDNQWKHVAMTADSATGVAKAYVNGQEVPLVTEFGPTTFSGQFNSVNNLFIGRRQDVHDIGGLEGAAGAAYYKGFIDELSLYNRAMSATQVQGIYIAGSGGKCTGSCISTTAWWKGEGSATDSSGNGNNGTLYNGTGFATGIVGQAFSFDGIDDHVRIPYNHTFDTPNALTLDTWIYPKSYPGYVYSFFTKWDSVDGVDQRSWTLNMYSNGTIAFILNTDGSHDNFQVISSSSSVPVNAWSHVAGVYDGSTMKIYINGQLQGQKDYSGGIFSGNSDVAIGAIATGGALGQSLSNFFGLIDEPTIYSRALSASEIQTIYTAGGAGKCGASATPTPSPTPTPNMPPTAGFTMVKGTQSATDGQTLSIITATTAPFFIKFTADRSFDPDGKVVGWDWNIDGASVSNTKTFTYGLDFGTHSISLVVTDKRGAVSQQVTGQVKISLPPPLQLFPTYGDDPNHPLDIRAENPRVINKRITADVVITNRSGTWFELDIDYNQGTNGAPNYSADDHVPTNFLVSPNSVLRFTARFSEGEYLHYHATRTSPAVFSMLAIDMIGKGLLGADITLPQGQADLVKGEIATLLKDMEDVNGGCASEVFELVTCGGDKFCVASKLVSLIRCTVKDAKSRNLVVQLITRLINKEAAKKWVNLASKDSVKLIAELLDLFDNVPKLFVLFDATIHANVDGWVRLEARRSSS